MTLEETGKRYGISSGQLEVYLSSGLPGAKTLIGTGSCTQEDFNALGLIDTLLRAGFTQEEAKQYLLLREKQKLLDSIGFIIWNKQKQEETR